MAVRASVVRPQTFANESSSKTTRLILINFICNLQAKRERQVIYLVQIKVYVFGIGDLNERTSSINLTSQFQVNFVAAFKERAKEILYNLVQVT